MPFSVKKIKGIDTSDLEKLGASVVDLAKYTEDEFSQVASALQGTEPDPIWNKPPPKPRRGTTAYADGANWNPGYGEGPYFFNQAGAWVPEFGSGSQLFVKARIQIFTASGTYIPSPGVVYSVIEGVGGGGGGGGAAAGATVNTSLSGGGGAAGGYSRAVVSAANIGVSQVVTIGAAGVGGAAGANNGTAGGASTVGTLLTANGGGGGLFGSSTQVGAGGLGGNVGIGDIVGAGQPGTTGGYNATRNTASVISTPGNGGSSVFGGGAITQGTGGGVSVNGVAARNYGSGGSGGFVDSLANANASGGNGTPGFVAITEFCAPTTGATTPIFVNYGTLASASSSTSVTPPLPLSRVNGNLLIAFFRILGVGTTPTLGVPGDWTIIAQNGIGAARPSLLAYRYVDGTETAPVLTSTAANLLAAQVYQYSGVKSSSPIGSIQSNVYVSTTGFMTCPAFISTAAGSLAVNFAWQGGAVSGTPPVPSGWELDTNAVVSATSLTVSDLPLPVLGSSTGAISVPMTVTSYDEYNIELKSR